MTVSDSHLKQAQHAMDTHSLDGLRQRAFKPGDKEALMEAAQQFEAIFLNMVMGSMRKANAVFEKDNLLDSRYTNMYRDMYDQQLTSELSSQGSLGLAELMVKQLGGDDSYVSESMNRSGANLDDPRMKNRADMSTQLSDQGGIDAGLYYGNQRVNTAKLSDGNATFDSPQSFIDALKPHAERIAKEAGINPDVLMAQAALETGWGKRLVPGKHGGSSNNLFNIKADTRWSGDKSHVSTLEFDGEVARKERAAFRSYANVEQSLQDYVDFIKEHPRYQQALQVADDPAQYAEALQSAGYATDPQYAQKIQSVLNNPAFVDKEI
ncbi:flagellar assembly peptidoglycan hydrolase FlgJ [Idiomarina loihiensis]|uniref:flagellar assembly peptidoglycan hydrolase FlgJ n=1 Tax=Idiomarina loihiensis TaxID=135577 RepID=UPI00129CCE1B|nr:flagellar assembly peptidoglycan hydrolase FlgJ [Idiomarina loihiensis]MRJ43399.1 flagellar assembly peptidoglycan hydrolase FlgJ [Idiomarina loihiensis]UTW31937.1 flagellar assembly peptidoglycan hydrolase FlgJ [Idiomarina loihiensis]